jgi:RNA polymerase sigma factor (sigma-70 family)
MSIKRFLFRGLRKAHEWEGMTSNHIDIDALKNGDEAAWTCAFHQLWPLALRVAQHPELVLSLEEAEDAASEALAQVVSLIEKVATFEETKALAVTIAYRRAVSAARRKSAAKRQPKTATPDVVSDRSSEDAALSGVFDPPLTNQELRELAVLLRHVLAGLDEETRMLLREKVGQGLSYEELSKKHDMPLGTACAKVARGLKKLRRILQESPGIMKEMKAFLR